MIWEVWKLHADLLNFQVTHLASTNNTLYFPMWVYFRVPLMSVFKNVPCGMVVAASACQNVLIRTMRQCTISVLLIHRQLTIFERHRRTLFTASFLIWSEGFTFTARQGRTLQSWTVHFQSVSLSWRRETKYDEWCGLGQRQRYEYAGPRADHDRAGPEYRYLDWYATANTDYVDYSTKDIQVLYYGIWPWRRIFKWSMYQHFQFTGEYSLTNP